MQVVGESEVNHAKTPIRLNGNIVNRDYWMVLERRLKRDDRLKRMFGNGLRKVYNGWRLRRVEEKNNKVK